MTKKMLTKPIGILGGTFDPIHFGHLRPAVDLLNQLPLAQIRFMPNHIPPHKTLPGSQSEQRLTMVNLAVRGQEKLVVDSRELNRDKPSYTIDTLKELKRELPHTPLCFIMGMDSLLSFTRWHQWQHILDYCHLIVCCRPGWQHEDNPETQALLSQRQTQAPADLQNQQAGRIYLAQVSQLDISASQIRQLVSMNQSASYLLPTSVLEYIQKNQLYTSRN